MKIACLYILSISLILFGKYCYSYGNVHRGNNGYTVAKNIGKSQLVKFPIVNQDPVITNNTLPLDSKQSIFSVENEDDDFGFRRRYVLLAACVLIMAYATLFKYLFKHFKNRPYSNKQIITAGNYKYLLQGALRI